MVKLLLIFTIFSVPLFTPSFGLGYEQTKVFVFLILTSLSMVFFLFDRKRQPEKYQLKITKIKFLSLLFISALFITSIFGVNPLNSTLGAPPYYQGFILYAYLLIFSFLFSIYDIQLDELSKVISVSAFIVSIWALKDLFLLKIFNQAVPLYDGRVVSTFGQPNFYAGYLLISLPFIYFLAFNHKYTLDVAKLNLVDTPGVSKDGEWRILAGISLLLSIAAIGISGSRSSIVLAFITILFVLFGYINYKAKILYFLFGVSVIAASLYLSFNLSTGLIYKEYLEPLTNNIHGSYKTSPEKRALIWPIILQLIKEKPVLGYGLENLGIVYPRYFDRFKAELGQLTIPYFDLRNLTINSAHNYPLDLLISAGALGFISWLLLISALIKKCQSKIILSSLLIYLAWVQFQNQSIVHLLLFWLIVGYIDKKHTVIND